MNTTALATRSETAVAAVEPRGFLIIESFKQAQEVAEYINKSALVPDAYRGKPADIVIAMQYGMELGLSPMQALQSVAVINGRPSIWGDALPGIIIALPDCEGIDDPEPEGTDPDKWVATCTVKRRGKSPKTRTFSKKDAEVAGLWGGNVWKKYPKRMLMARARAFAIRDAYPDRMKGIITAEEAMDIEPTISEPRRVGESATPAAAQQQQQSATTAPVAPADAAAPTPSPASTAAAPASPATPNDPVEKGVKVLDTKWVSDGNGGYGEVTTNKGVFVTRDKADPDKGREQGLYDSLASCEGTDTLLLVTYRNGKRQKAGGGTVAVKIALKVALDEGAAPQQGSLPTGGDHA